jgi:hypothetical protein
MGRQPGKMGKTVKTAFLALTVPTVEMGEKVGPGVAEEMAAMAQVLPPTINTISININRKQILPTAVMAETGEIPITAPAAMVARGVKNMLIPVQSSRLTLKHFTIPALSVLLLCAGPLKAETPPQKVVTLMPVADGGNGGNGGAGPGAGDGGNGGDAGSGANSDGGDGGTGGSGGAQGGDGGDGGSGDNSPGGNGGDGGDGGDGSA